MTERVTLAGRRWTPKGRYEPWPVRERARMRERTSRDGISDDLELVMEDVHYFAGIP